MLQVTCGTQSHGRVMALDCSPCAAQCAAAACRLQRHRAAAVLLRTQVTFSPSGVDKPQQAMLMLTAADGSAAYVLAKVKAPAHTITVTAASIEKQLGKQVRRAAGQP